MKAFFLGQREANHTAFIRIRTSGDNKFLPLIIPFEVEVSSSKNFTRFKIISKINESIDHCFSSLVLSSLAGRFYFVTLIDVR